MRLSEIKQGLSESKKTPDQVPVKIANWAGWIWLEL